MFPEAAENLFYLFIVSSFISRINENVIKVNHHANIQHVREDVIHKTLKSGGGIGQTFGDYHPFKRTVFSPEGCLPFVTFADTDEMVGMTQIYLGIDSGLTGGV